MSLFSHLVDLITHNCCNDPFSEILRSQVDGITETTEKITHNQAPPPDLKKLDAFGLSMRVVAEELERRNLVPRGFYSDDANLLQTLYNEEYELYVERLAQEARDAQMAEIELAIERKKQLFLQGQQREEIDALASDPNLVQHLYWIMTGRTKIVNDSSNELDASLNLEMGEVVETLKQGQAHKWHMPVNNITGRLFAKALWDVKIRLVDVNLAGMDLLDITGSYLCRALHNNKTIQKLYLNENQLGSQTCVALRESIQHNTTLKCLVLDSNPLLGSNDEIGKVECCCTCCDHNEDLTAVNALVNMVETNNHLVSLSLWRCNLGPRAGKAFASAIQHNKALRYFEVRCNDFEPEHCRVITERLQANQISYQEILAIEKQREEARRSQFERMCEEQKEMERKEAEEKWLHDQMNKRAQVRADLTAYAVELTHLEEEAKNREKEESKRRKEQQAAAEAAKKKKKGRKKKAAKK